MSSSQVTGEPLEEVDFEAELAALVSWPSISAHLLEHLYQHALRAAESPRVLSGSASCVVLAPCAPTLFIS